MKRANARLPRNAIVLLSLLGASVALTAVLAWQAQRAAVSHLAAAQNVLREYGLLAADEFARRTMSMVGYAGYFRLITFLKNAPAEDPAALPELVRGASEEVRKAASLAREYVFFDPAAGAASSSRKAVGSELRAALAQASAQGGAGDAPFGTLAYGADGTRQLLIYVALPGGRLRAFAVDSRALEPWFAQVVQGGPLLPVALADGKVSNDVVRLSVTDPNGTLMFRTGQHDDPYLQVSRGMGDDYQGIFAGFSVTASVDPEAAPSLVIGGLPQSRVPLLLALMVLTIGMLGAAIWLIRREQSVMRLREDFVAQASHELRTPLTQIRMFAETLLLDRVRSEHERERALRIINRESVRLVQLADNLLAFSPSGQRRRIEAVTQPVAAVVHEVCRNFVASGQAATLQEDLDPDIRAPLDKAAICQVLVNLLDNAVKYGPAEQSIRVVLRKRGHWLQLAVMDEGPGVPVSESEAVWAPFQRLERERANGSGGAGIGLAVVRELVEAHGGRCRFEPGDGGTAIVELPLDREAS